MSISFGIDWLMRTGWTFSMSFTSPFLFFHILISPLTYVLFLKTIHHSDEHLFSNGLIDRNGLDATRWAQRAWTLSLCQTTGNSWKLVASWFSMELDGSGLDWLNEPTWFFRSAWWCCNFFRQSPITFMLCVEEPLLNCKIICIRNHTTSLLSWMHPIRCCPVVIDFWKILLACYYWSSSMIWKPSLIIIAHSGLMLSILSRCLNVFCVFQLQSQHMINTSEWMAQLNDCVFCELRMGSWRAVKYNIERSNREAHWRAITTVHLERDSTQSINIKKR